MKTLFSILLLLTGLFLSGANLLLEPAAKKLNGKLPAGIQLSVKEEQIDLTIDGAHLQLGFEIPVSSEMKFLRIRTRMRTSGVIPDKAGWQNARLAMRFHDRNWKPVGKWPEVFEGKGSSGWIECDRIYPIPHTAARLSLAPANFGTAGKVEFFNLSVEPVKKPETKKNLLVDPALKLLKNKKVPAGIQLSVKGEQVDLTIDGARLQLGFEIPVSSEMKFLRIRTRMRTSGVIPDKAGWQNARLAMRFHDRNWKPVGKWPEVFEGKGSSGWIECDRIYPIPHTAARLSLAPANFGTAGKVEFFNLKVEVFSNHDDLDLDAAPPNGDSPEKLGSLDDAWRETTPTRERICLNGLWEFRPLLPGESVNDMPSKGSGWGYFKVPGAWPYPGNGMRFYISPLFQPKFSLKDLNSAWYRRTFRIPERWIGKRIILSADLIQSCAQVTIDGKRAGELYYPGGELDLTGKLIPGRMHTLAMLVSAKPEERSTFMAPGRLTSVKGKLQNRGITGDLWLDALPGKAAISDVHVITSVKNRKITFDTGFLTLPEGVYQLEAEVFDTGKSVRKFVSAPFHSRNCQRSRHSFDGSWSDPKLWDTDAPQNLYVAKLKLLSRDGKILDCFLPQEFGFREFTVEGRNFLLNGKKLHLRMLVTKTPQEADFSSERWVEHTIDAARGIGANFLIGWNYSFAPGVFCHPAGFHKGTSKRGMLTSLTLPHVKQFKPNIDSPEQAEAFRRQTEHLIRRYQNIPGVVMYVMNHNAMGYPGDQNPQRIGTEYLPENHRNVMNDRAQALKAESIAKSIDASRPVYHHESGNLGKICTLNCYLNWSPRQERSDWLADWEKNGIMPVMFVEWGLPHVASWSSYRGPGFIWWAVDLQCLWINEYNAAILGEEAYRAEKAKSKLYSLQEQKIKGNRAVGFWTLDNWLLNKIEDIHRVRAYYAERSIRDLRWRGISGLLPWDQFVCWSWAGDKEGVGDNPDRFRNLKQPGIVPDIFIRRGEYINDPFSICRLNTTGKALAANFGEYLGWIAGKENDETENGHNFFPGETVRKSLALLNDSRRETEVRWKWQVPALKLEKSGTLRIAPGERSAVPVEFQIPKQTSGEFLLNAQIEFSAGKQFVDHLTLNVLPESPLNIHSTVGIFDPEGKTGALLKKTGLKFQNVRSDADLDKIELLILGRNALVKNPLHLAKRLRNGLKLLVLEQPLPVIERLGLRGNEQGFREVFSLSPEFCDMRDWRGSATQLPEYLASPQFEYTPPRWHWLGFEHTRVWRSGNRGSITEVVMEKPSVGNWLPLLQAGFDLQYTPLLEFREGKGRILFCQLAVTERTEPEPEAETIIRKALARLDRSRTETSREVLYAGSAVGADLLRQLQIPFKRHAGKAADDALLVLGPEAPRIDLTEAVKRGAHILALGLDRDTLETMLPGAFHFESGLFESDFISGLRKFPELAGISNADLHWRGKISFDGFANNETGRALAIRRIGKGVFVALQSVPWKFDAKEFYCRTTVKRSSFLVSRLMANLGAESKTDFYANFDGSNGNLIFELPNNRWLGLADPHAQGRSAGYWKSEYQTNPEWRRVDVDTAYDSQSKELGNYLGDFWYRLEFNLPAAAKTLEAKLHIGPVDDESWVWLNGEFLGEVTKKTHPKNYWEFPRSYPLEAGKLRPGRNVLVILCRNLAGSGGIFGIPALTFRKKFNFYTDTPQSSDNPYQYYRW